MAWIPEALEMGPWRKGGDLEAGRRKAPYAKNRDKKWGRLPRAFWHPAWLGYWHRTMDRES